MISKLSLRWWISNLQILLIEFWKNFSSQTNIAIMFDLGDGWSCYSLFNFWFNYAVLITVLFGNNWREPILVKFRPIINQILEVSEVNQKIDIKMWFLHEWFDERLVWNPLEYGNITVLHIPADKVRRFSIFRVRPIFCVKPYEF